MKKFEYRVIELTPESYQVGMDVTELNEMGEKGWELVSCVKVKNKQFGKTLTLFLKRELPKR